MSETQTVALPPALPTFGGLNRYLSGKIRRGRLTIVTPSGACVTGGAGNGPEATLVLHRWRALRKLLFAGDIGFAESYIAGDWDSPDLPALIHLAAINVANDFAGTWFRRQFDRWRHRLNANSKSGSRRNIRFHYDLGNEFYRLWLDEGMAYSSAFYTSAGQSLEDAQATKQDRALALLQAEPGNSVLEIGCGWGGMVERLHEKHNVTAVTLSPAQLDWTSARVPGADVRLQDYRDISGTFDRIVSIEMLEAVGEAWWPTYFAALRDHLVPGGRAVLQVITIAEEKFANYRRTPDFIQRYVFPGGMLPPISAIRHQAESAGLTLLHRETFGASYALTLAEWRRRFHAAWPRIATLGFDDRFRRLWDYYLGYCEGGFRAQATDVGFYVLAKPA